MSEYTKGPWHTLSLKDGGIGIFLGGPPEPDKRYIPILLAAIPAEIGGYEPERIANAHLIAAAPELYEALIDMLNLGDYATAEYAYLVRQRAREAINKAEGKS